MENYREMYAKLFNKITDVIKELQDIQKEAEEMYIKAANENSEGGAKVIKLVPRCK